MANSSGGNRRSVRDPAKRRAPPFPSASNRSNRNRVAAPDTRNSRVSRQGLVNCITGSSASTGRGLFTCQSHGT
ncbi:hypothetical protein D3C78_1859640 [compost metagenome]